MLLDTDGSVPWNDILRNLGAALLGLGRAQEAVLILEMGLANRPDNDELLANLSLCYLDLGDLEGAERSVRRALTVNPHQGSAHNTLGEIRYQQGEYLAAMREFRTGLSLDPDNAARRYNLALTLEKLGNHAETCAAWEESLGAARSAPDRENVAARMARIGCTRPP